MSDRAEVEDIRIVRFFDQLHEQLWAMPWSECSRINRELHLHLDEIVAARLAAGSSTDNATEYALNQIGQPAELGKKLRQEWYMSDKRPAGVSLRTLGDVYLWLFSMLITVGAIILMFFSPHHNDINNHNVAILLFAPAIAGLILGAKRSRESVASMVHMAAGLYVVDVLIYLAGSIWIFFSPGAHVPISGPWIGLIFGSVLIFGLVTLVGAVPAYLVSSWKQGAFYRIALSDFRLRGRMAAH